MSNLKPFPIICIVGDRGAGKTVFAVYLIEKFLNENSNVYTNIEVNFKSKYLHNIDFTDIKENPEKIKDGYLILDEQHVGSDSYEFLSKGNRQLSEFATQIRKRKITWIYITQRFKRIDKRLREQTDFIYEITGYYKLLNDFKSVYNYSILRVFNIADKGIYEPINKKYFFGTKYFSKYNTNQLILRNGET